MKPHLTVLLLFLGYSLIAQIEFEPIPNEPGFNTDEILKCLDGNYLISSITDRTSIFTSDDLESWTRSIGKDFFSPDLGYGELFADGTKIVGRSPNSLGYIQRGESWEKFSESQASTIINDTLFTFRDKRIDYSVDQGRTFQTLQTLNTTLDILNTNINARELWMSDEYIYLRPSQFASYITVYNRSDGERVFIEYLEEVIRYSVFNANCNEIYLIGFDNGFKFNLDNLSMDKFPINSIFPDGMESTIFYHDGKNYAHYEDKIYTSSNCELDWELWKEDSNFVDKKIKFVDDQTMIAFERGGEEFMEYDLISDTNVKHNINIDFPSITFIDQTKAGYQICRSNNIFYTKHVSDDAWKLLGQPDPNYTYFFKYTHTGRLIATLGFNLYSSSDNGESYTLIDLPTVNGNFFNLKSINDSLLVVSDPSNGQFAYSFDDGITWEMIDDIPRSMRLDDIFAEQVGDYIYFLSETDGYEIRMTRHNLITKDNESQIIGKFDVLSKKYILSKTGKFYIQSFDSNDDLFGFFSWSFDEGLIDHGYHLEFDNIRYLWGSNDVYDLFITHPHGFTIWDGDKFRYEEYRGIPADVSNSNSSDIPIYYYYSKDGYIFGIRDHRSRIYRTVGSLDDIPIIDNIVQTEELDVSIYPNPAIDFLQVDFDSREAIDYTYRIIDVSGKVLVSGKLTESIDIRALQLGTYSIQILDKTGKSFVQKFVKM